jgi:hypothetical protein
MLLTIAVVLCAGWIVVGGILGRQVRRQSALAKRIEALEAKPK